MMLNEVRRKPEKPRIWYNMGIWCCSGGNNLLGCWASTPRKAYEKWKKEQSTPSNRA